MCRCIRTPVNQIIGRPISQATGFSNVIENGGEVRTRGFEGMLSGKVIKGGKFQWTSSLNYGSFRSVVTRLPEGVNQYVTGTARVLFGGGGGSNTVFYIAKGGGRIGDMYGTGFVEIDGEILFDENGLPVQDGTLRNLRELRSRFFSGME
ncbi:MAG: hypothetical protein U5L96_00895 [Owenweeksia sp.]|nr:hypothetical protein [Owenweeksia sp.]